MPDIVLSPLHLKALLAISDQKDLAMPKHLIKDLLDQGYIAIRYPKGWATSSKGREYLRRLKLKR